MSDVQASTATGSATAWPSTGGVLAPLPETGISIPSTYGSPTFGPSVDPMSGGVDFVRVMHAIRRCWLPAVAAGLALAVTAALLVWFFLPQSYQAVAWLRVRSNPGMFSGNAGAGEYEQYRKTQLQLIKSPDVLRTALDMPEIARLDALRDEQDKIEWLVRHVEVATLQESEVVQIRLRGDNPRELKLIVDAVANSYTDKVVKKEKAERLQRRDMLEKKYKENMAEVRSRLETFNNLAKSLGSRDSVEVATERSLLLDHLGTLRAQLTQLQRDVNQIDMELALLDATARDSGNEDGMAADVVDASLLRHPQVAELAKRRAELEETIAFQMERSARGANDPAVKRLEAQREDLQRRIDELAAELRPQMLAEVAGDSVRHPGAAAANPVVLRMRREILSQQLEETSKEFDKVAKEVTALGNANADLEARRNEIAQLQSVTNQMGIQLAAADVDIRMPDRVEVLSQASEPGTADDLFRTLLTVLAGLVGFGAGFGLVVLIEYRTARLATVEDVTKRIGLRVIGTVPTIQRAGGRANEDFVNECIDGVRTIIAQTGKEAPKVILVTSAVEHEGKTTFAARLAASLARGGARTLLLDGDLRNPKVHMALELDLRSGFPELLRAEIGNDESVQPTSIDGLFAVTGGNCDYASINALARPEAARIVQGFRSAFDHVVIDAGPVLAFADALLLGRLSDVAIVVTMRDVSRVPYVVKAVDRLRSVGVRVLGTVINRVTDDGPRRRYTTPTPA